MRDDYTPERLAEERKRYALGGERANERVLKMRVTGSLRSNPRNIVP